MPFLGIVWSNIANAGNLYLLFHCWLWQMKYCDCACKLWCGDGPCILLTITFLLISCILTSAGCLPPLQCGRMEFQPCTAVVSYDVFSVKSLLLWLIFTCYIFIIIFLKISNNMHHTLDDSKVLTVIPCSNKFWWWPPSSSGNSPCKPKHHC